MHPLGAWLMLMLHVPTVAAITYCKVHRKIVNQLHYLQKQDWKFYHANANTR